MMRRRDFLALGSVWFDTGCDTGGTEEIAPVEHRGLVAPCGFSSAAM